MILLFIGLFVVFLTLGILILVLPTQSLDIQADSDGPWIFQQGQLSIPSDHVDRFMSNINAKLRVFYFLENLPRTNTVILDTENASLDPATNTYNICPLTNNTSCAHPGFIKLLNLGSRCFIELLQAPDASRPGLPKTQLVVQTQKNTASGNVQYLETFALDAFPLQKWVMVTVVRNGNRISVYYNDRLVLSKNTTYVPNFVSGSGTFADAMIRGQAKYLQTYSGEVSLADVATDYKIMADTRGEPINKFYSKLSINLCPSGDCFRGPQIKPTNPLMAWNSDVM